MIYALTYLLGIVTGYMIRYYRKREKGDGVTVEFTFSGDDIIEWTHPLINDGKNFTSDFANIERGEKWSTPMEGLYLIEEDDEEQNEEGFDVFLN